MESRVPASAFRETALAALAVFFGVAMTLCVRGYRFGESNHAVYLIDALRRADPALLQHDWWTRSTLQYHFVFNALTATLMRLGVLGPAFAAGYLALAVLLHIAWRRLTILLGGNDGTYLLSVVLFYLLAGGLGLGVYHFLQDSAFLPSNIANVAMLGWACFWIAGRPAAAGACLGISGLFHINHALVGLGLWACTSLWDGRRAWGRGWWLGSTAVVALCAVQIVPALRAVVARTGKLPLAEFIDLFVHVRHPHHFDPRSWHWGLWLSFLAPLPPAVIAWRARMKDRPSPELRRAGFIFVLFAAMIAVALVGAGFWFVSETLVQLNLYRFSIYPKLLSCIAVAWLAWDRTPRGRLVTTLAAITVLVAGFAVTLVLQRRGMPAVAAHNVRVAWLFAPLAVASLACFGQARVSATLRVLLVLLFVAVAAVQSGGRQWPLGFRVEGLAGDDADYLALAEWARDHTPVDAVFLVPPDEESFRLRARRAIVINFKGVPQLSAELPEWRDRMLDALDLRSTADLLALPRPMGRTLAAIRARYAEVPPERLFAVARRRGARFAVLTRSAGPAHEAALVYSDTNGHYFLYDLGRED